MPIPSMQRPFGILNAGKPPGVTSRWVVDRVARLVKPAKAGHAGTLDPLASGVLVVCVGSATRLISAVQRQPKVYRAVFQLGRRSDTDDVTGDVVIDAGADPVSVDELRALLPRFVGRIEQVPPKFSAVHVNGRRAYQLARSGQKVDLPPRTVHVSRIDLIAFEYPRLQLEIECGSGTYIRSIGRDLGEELGCGAVMSDLVRTRIGPYRLETAVEPASWTAENLRDNLLPAVTAVADFPRYRCPPDRLEELRHGRPIPCDETEVPDDATIAVLTPEGRLACLARCNRGNLSPKQVFPFWEVHTSRRK